MVAWFDSVILNWFQSIQNEFLTVLFKAITFLGEGGLIWIALGLCLIAYKKTRWVGISVLLALLFSLLVGNVTLKPLVARPRPCWRNSLVDLLIQNPKDYSFPSGHALSSFAAAMAIFMNRRKMGVAALSANLLYHLHTIIPNCLLLLNLQITDFPVAHSRHAPKEMFHPPLFHSTK